jgi:hypothetical protein
MFIKLMINPYNSVIRAAEMGTARSSRFNQDDNNSGTRGKCRQSDQFLQ